MAFTTLNLGLTLTIPTVGTRNWGATLLSTTWTKISQHAHTGSGDGTQLGTNSFSNYSVTKDKLKKDAGLFQYATLVAPVIDTHTIDFANGSIQKIDLENTGGDLTLTLSNPVQGVVYKLITLQGATPRDIIWPASVLWPQGQKPILTQTENAVDKIQLYFDGTNYLGDWNTDYL